MINTCGVTRLIALGWLVGFGVATLVGSSAAGWVAALLTMAVVIGIQRARGGGGSCPIPTSPSREQATGLTVDEVPRRRRGDRVPHHGRHRRTRPPELTSRGTRLPPIAGVGVGIFASWFLYHQVS